MEEKKNVKPLDCDKLVIAIIQDNEYYDVITELNNHGFYVTILQSTGGFLRKRNTTIMIGVNHSRLDTIIDIFKKHGEHIENRYEALQTGSYSHITTMASIPVRCGGVTYFVLDVDQCGRL